MQASQFLNTSCACDSAFFNRACEVQPGRARAGRWHPCIQPDARDATTGSTRASNRMRAMLPTLHRQTAVSVGSARPPPNPEGVTTHLPSPPSPRVCVPACPCPFPHSGGNGDACLAGKIRRSRAGFHSGGTPRLRRSLRQAPASPWTWCRAAASQPCRRALDCRTPSERPAARRADAPPDVRSRSSGPVDCQPLAVAASQPCSPAASGPHRSHAAGPSIVRRRPSGQQPGEQMPPLRCARAPPDRSTASPLQSRPRGAAGPPPGRLAAMPPGPRLSDADWPGAAMQPGHLAAMPPGTRLTDADRAARACG